MMTINFPGVTCNLRKFQHKPAIYEVTVPKQNGDVAIVVTGGCEDSNLKSHLQLKWDKFEASFEFLKVHILKLIDKRW